MTEENINSKSESKLEKALSVLTEKQRLYVDSRLIGMNPYASCKAAGYNSPESHSHKIEKMPRVRDALEAASQVAREKLNMTRDDVLEGLMEALQASATATEMTNVWKEIGKIIGAYQPIKIEHTHNIGELTNNQLQQLSNHELVSMAQQPGAIIDPKDDIIDAEFEVMKESIEPPTPIDYDNAEEPEDG